MRILVTGGSGYIGSRLSRRLLDDGHSVSLVLPSEAPLDLLGDSVGRIAIFRDAHDWWGVQRAVRESRPDLVFHLASLVLTSHKPEDVKPLVLSNILFGAELLEAMREEGVLDLVVAGTSWQHFEDADYDPVNLYAATKQAFEDLLAFWSNTTSLRTIILKLFDVYGPDDPRPKLVPLLLGASRRGEEIRLTPGEQFVDIVHVDDVVQAFVTAGLLVRDLAPGARETYSVSSGAAIQLREFVRKFEEALGNSIPIEWGGRPYRPREMMLPWSRGIPLPNWRPAISLGDGFRHLLGRGQ